MRRASALFLALLSNSTLAAASLPEPLSYAKPSPGGRFVLVVFGSAEAEAKLKDGDNKRHSAAVRAKYPRPGMYRAGEVAELLYPLAADFPVLHAAAGVAGHFFRFGYVPDENVHMTSDGRCVVRIEGDWWRTKAYPGGARLPAAVAQKQLDAPAVRFFGDGNLLKSYSLDDVVTDAAALPHSPEHILWHGGAVLREDSGEFLLDMQDTNRIAFDIRTGEIVSKEKLGFGSRLGRTMISVTLGLVVLLGLSWAGYAFFRLRTRRASGAVPLPPVPSVP